MDEPLPIPTPQVLPMMHEIPVPVTTLPSGVPQLPPMPKPGDVSQAVAPMPFIQERREFKINYPADAPYNPLLGQMQGATGKKGVSPSNHSLAEWLNIACGQPGFKVEILRRLPATWEGIKLKQGTIHTFERILPFSDIQQTIEQLFGGGDYSISVLNYENKPVMRGQLSVEGSPIISDFDEEEHRRFTGGRNLPPGARMTHVPGTLFTQRRLGAPRDFATQYGGEEDEEITKAHKRERLAMAEASALGADAKRIEALERYDKIVHRGDYEKEDRFRAEKELKEKELQRKYDEQGRREEREHSSMEKLLLAVLANKPQDNGNSTKEMFGALQLIMQQFATQFDGQLKVIQTIMSQQKPPDNNLNQIELMKMASSANDKIVQLTQSNSDKLITILMGERNKQTGFGQISEVLGLINQIRDYDSPEDEDGEWLNPNAGFFQNAGNGILALLKGLVSGAAKGGGAALLPILNSILQKPAANTQFSDAELAPIASALEQQAAKNARVLPAPAGLPPRRAAPVPVQTPVQQIPPQAIRRGRPLATMVADPLEMFAAPIQVIEVENPKPVSVSQVHASGPVTVLAEDVGSEAENWIDEAIAVMLVDIKERRREHDWVEIALEKWPGELLDKLVQAPDDTVRLKIIQERASPELFAHLQAALLQKENWQSYSYWIEALHALLQEHKQEAVA